MSLTRLRRRLRRVVPLDKPTHLTGDADLVVEIDPKGLTLRGLRCRRADRRKRVPWRHLLAYIASFGMPLKDDGPRKKKEG